MLTTRRALLFPMLSSAVIGLAAACGGSSSDGPPSNDGGADSGTADGSRDGHADDSDAGSDAGTADASVRPTRLAEGKVILHGVTTDDHAIYTKFTDQGRSLEAARLSDGLVTTLHATLPDGASVGVKSNVVAVWTDIDSATGLGTLAYGTPGGTFRQNAANLSLRDTFWASADGTHVAFYANTTLAQAVPSSAELVVAVTATGDSTTVLSGAERISFDESSCGSHVGFGGETLIVAYCPAGSPAARLVTVPAVVAPVRRVLVDGGLTTFWSADATGSKIFVVAEDDHEGRVVTNNGTVPAPSSPVEAEVDEGFMMRDGSAVVYRTVRTLRRAPIGAAGPLAPMTIAAGEARRILDVSFDQTSILFHSLPGRPIDVQNPDGERYVDLLTIATTATNGNPRALVATERALPLGLSGNGAHALYFSNGPKLNAVATDGTGERSMPITFNGMSTTPSGSGAVLSMNPRPLGAMTLVDLVLADFAAGGQRSGPAVTKSLVEGVPSGGFHFGSTSSKKLVYVLAAGDSPGLYDLELP